MCLDSFVNCINANAELHKKRLPHVQRVYDTTHPSLGTKMAHEKKKKKNVSLTLSMPNFRRHFFFFFLTNYRLERRLYVKLKY